MYCHEKAQKVTKKIQRGRGGAMGNREWRIENGEWRIESAQPEG
jgi:hypothetical protein